MRFRPQTMPATIIPDRAPGQGSGSSAAGQQAFNAASNYNYTRNGAAGPGTTVTFNGGQLSPVTPNGNFRGNGELNFSSGTANDPITVKFGYQIDAGAVSVLNTQVGTFDANGTFTASFPDTVGTCPAGSKIRFVIAVTTAVAHNFSALANAGSIFLQELPQ